MSFHTYKQDTKNRVRHTVIRKAVELLTSYRSEACCVRNSYVRDLHDYFVSLPETHEKYEAEKIDHSYIREWEQMHSSLIGTKRPSELSVCYLSGPEPENDFNEFVDMGVLPQNIWAFESEKNSYLQALNAVDGSSFMQPKIVKMSIERFFENSPKKFDIVYIDACASLISDQHALRCVASLFQYHRLNSPGVLITNFAYLDNSNPNEAAQYTDLISRYNILRHNRTANLINESGRIHFKHDSANTNAYVTKEYVEKIKTCAKEYAGKLFRPVDTRMKNEELITMLAYLAYIARKDHILPGECLNIFVRNQKINARFSRKGNITTRLGEISSTNDPVFGEALDDVKLFIKKLQILCGDGFQDFNKMLGHTRKNALSRTNQNFYLLWIALSHIEVARLNDEKVQIFDSIKNIFLKNQDISDDNFDIKSYIHTLETI